jgi:hypothetical protein
MSDAALVDGLSAEGGMEGGERPCRSLPRTGLRNVSFLHVFLNVLS